MEENLKQLLLKDLSARLPYGVKVLADIDKTFDEGHIGIINMIQPYVGDKYPKLKEQYLLYLNGCLTPLTIDEVRPYLFPMSSMTEEQILKYHNFCDVGLTEWGNELYYDCAESLDWLNENHFDYRGLIDKGLALDATGLNIY